MADGKFETTKEFVKRARDNLADFGWDTDSIKRDLDAALDRLEGQQRLVADFITKAEETLK